MLAEPPIAPSDIDPAIVLVVFGTLAGAAFATAVVLGVRARDVLPVAACVGALICAFNEPIYDLLGKIVYASDHPVVYTNFERDIPWFLVVGYVPWVGLLPYVISRLIAAGAVRRTLHLIALGSFVSVVVIELLGTSLEAWTYYGDAPLKYIGVAPQMAAMPIVGGFLLYAASSRVRSMPGRALAGLVIPTMALPLVYASTSWPLYTGLYASIPEAVEWLAALAALALAAATVAFTTDLAQRLRGAGERRAT